MLTLFGTYIIAISIGAGCAVINDLFFITSLKHHKVKSYEFNILKQLNAIQLVLILWIVLVEATFFAAQIQTSSIQSILGVSVAKFVIEIIILFTILFIRQVHIPALFRHQHLYGHLSESFIGHSNALIMSAVTSLTSWLFIVFITSSEFKLGFIDFGFTNTMIMYFIVTLFANVLFLSLKNKVLHLKK